MPVCEAHAYVRKDDKDELFMENVDSVLPYEGGLVLENIFGQRKMIKARIRGAGPGRPQGYPRTG